METADNLKVCKLFKLNHRQLCVAVEKGQLPIGVAIRPENENGHWKLTIYEKWLQKLLSEKGE